VVESPSKKSAKSRTHHQYAQERTRQSDKAGGAGLVKVGQQASASDRSMTSIRESRSGKPRLSAASTSPARRLSVSSERRAATVTAVIVPPRTMPTTGTTVTPVAGTTPVSMRGSSTAMSPMANQAASHGEP
jgi:hypothetical protein